MKYTEKEKQEKTIQLKLIKSIVKLDDFLSIYDDNELNRYLPMLRDLYDEVNSRYRKEKE